MKGTVLLMLAALSLPAGISEDDAVQLEHGVSFIGMEGPVEVNNQSTYEGVLYFAATDALTLAKPHVFVHLEQKNACRLVRDVPLELDEDGGFKAEISIRVIPTCKVGDVEVFTGVYDRDTGQRLQVESMPSADNRVHAGYVRLIEGEPSAERTVFSPSDMWWRGFWQRVAPWKGWLLGVLAAIFLGLALSMSVRRWGGALTMPKTVPRWVLWGVAGLLLIPLMASLLAALDFIKDDAYISFRYAHNLANGDGFVFNVGDRLEGYTNFLWTLLMVPFEAMHLDLFQVSEVLGTALSIGVLVVMVLLALRHHEADWSLSHVWAALWLSTSSSLALWATSGMEQPLAMFLPFVAAYVTWRAHSNDLPRQAVIGGVLMGLACMTRPELHLIGFLVGLPLLWQVVRTRTLPVVPRNWAFGLLGVTVPFHAFRLLYYGSLFPNTFYVKTGGSRLVMLAGLEKLNEMFSFNALGALVMLVPLAFIDRKWLVEKLVALAVAAGFMFYIVKVGVDEMRWHRLYLPALPFLVFLAGLGLKNFCVALTRLLRPRWSHAVVYGLVWVLVGFASWQNFAFTYKKKAGFNGRGDLSGTYHPDMGKFLTRHERPHGLVAFQDMGSTPYHAPDLDFLDFIGLVDGTIARARYDYGLHAFTSTEFQANADAYAKDMQAYVMERNPEWIILTAYVSESLAADAARRVSSNLRQDGLVGQRNNSYQFGIDSTRWFKDEFVHVRTWPRSSTYYLSLFRRKDLWAQTPGEVVLDEVPAGIGGPKVRFEGGLEMLGAELEEETLERHEFFITTWWKLPGPMPADTLFFVHVTREDYQAPMDHVPGDFMYPAERWQAGQIVEDRVLFQVPVNMGVGTYEVYIGAYRQLTGERVGIVEGPNDGQNRVLLGTVTINPLYSFIHHTIPPTVVEEQRKYPDRIIDAGR